jgi:hypothetical protein
MTTSLTTNHKSISKKISCVLWAFVLPIASGITAYLYGQPAWLFYIIAIVVGVAVHTVTEENDEFLAVSTVSLMLLIVAIVLTFDGQSSFLFQNNEAIFGR